MQGSLLPLVDCAAQRTVSLSGQTPDGQERMCRDEALKVVLDFTASPRLGHVARLLYQLEVLLLQSGTSSKKVCHGLISYLTSVPGASVLLLLIY